MAPKVWKGARGGVLKTTKRAAAAKGLPPSSIKGLAGFRKASRTFSGTVDKGVAQQNAALASRAVVADGLDARLICIIAATNTDKYYVLQCLEDTKVPASKARRFYAYQRWGRTGTGGVCRLQGPMEQEKAQSHLFKVFKAKTGAAWGDLKAGEKAKAGMYWLSAASEADPRARWEYRVADSIDGKSNGWFPYDVRASEQVEELYAEHIANKKGSNSTSKRFVPSGKFTYCLHMDELRQKNTTTGKERQIRRTLGSKVALRRLGSSPVEETSRSASAKQASKTSISATTSSIFDGLFRADTAATIAAPLSLDGPSAKPSSFHVKRSLSSCSSLPGLPGKRQRLAKGATVIPVSNADMHKVAERGGVGELPQSALKSWLGARSISTTGKKPDLVDRVYSLLEDVD